MLASLIIKTMVKTGASEILREIQGTFIKTNMAWLTLSSLNFLAIAKQITSTCPYILKKIYSKYKKKEKKK